MIVYKEKQFLVFDLENGSKVKYDFAEKKAYGKQGKPVKNLCCQLRGYTVQDIIDSCKDPAYGLFLEYIWKKERRISNIGTILSRVCNYSKYEQFFSAGLKFKDNLRYELKDIPKSLIKQSKNKNIIIDNDIIETWYNNPNFCNLAYSLDYMSIDERDIKDIISARTWGYRQNGRYENFSTCDELINIYNYNVKSLLLYFDHLKTFEALEYFLSVCREFYDYVKMMNEISPKYDKYPRNFLTSHRIASRNYNRFKQQFDEEKFAKTYRKDYEMTIDDYVIVCPKVTQDVKDEAVMQNNCVASYINNVIDGSCHILFMRKKDDQEKSLVTLEVRNDKIVQAKGQYNREVYKNEQEIIDAWEQRIENRKKKAEKNNVEEESMKESVAS